MYEPGAGTNPLIQATVLLLTLPSLQPTSSLLPKSLLDPWRSAVTCSPRSGQQPPFSSAETSSHQQALHVRPFLTWITDLLPHCFLWKRSCCVTEMYEKHFPVPFPSPPSSLTLVILASMNANKNSRPGTQWWFFCIVRTNWCWGIRREFSTF